MKIKPCTHCGDCCRSGIPCYFGQILFDITEASPQVCPALEKVGDLYWCGLIRNPVKWFTPLVGDVKWKCEAMAEIAALWIGIGDGCGISPSAMKTAKRMKFLGSIKGKKVKLGDNNG